MMESNNTALRISFNDAPTLARFFQSDGFVRGILGPVGSGKSFACCYEILRRAIEQMPSPRDGIKYSRFAIVRNTTPMLRTTTLKTWLEVAPEDRYGNVRYAPPIAHHIVLPARGDAAGIDCEIIFLALDRPKDVRKLLSLELTGAWVNEARELPKAVIDGLTHRVGRYPSKRDGGATWRGVIMDTNAPDDDHWYYTLAEKECPSGKFPWAFFRQPAALFEGPLGARRREDDIEAGGAVWRINPKAENVSNLPTDYYRQLVAGKTRDWIRCYVCADYGFVQEGSPVWPEYDDVSMTGTPETETGLPIQVGLDFGLTPAAVFGQRRSGGRWHVLDELVTFDMGLKRFTNDLKALMEMRFAGCEAFVWGDPAGRQRDQIYETTAFDHLNANGILARPTWTNDFKTRREALALPMGRLIDGKPGLVVHERCVQLRKALAGGYYFQRVPLPYGQERFRDAPVKNRHSHVGDAAAYMCLGGGEHRALTGRGAKKKPGMLPQTPIKPLDFDVF